MGYISGMVMGKIVQKFLEDNRLYTVANYRIAYAECKDRCRKIQSGTGNATRYCYYEDEIIPVLIDWKKHLN